MELPLHVVTDEWGDGWVVRIVDHKAVIQFEAIVDPAEDHTEVGARADRICKAVNNHKRLVKAAREVCESWPTGKLAAAVRELNWIIDNLDKELED